MKKFIIKILTFLFPVILLALFSWKFYSEDKGDLLKIGYLMDLYPTYRAIFKEDFKKDILFSKVSIKSNKKKFDIMTIGDSFSEQSSFGYKNLLAQDFQVLHFDRFLSNNQIQTLYSLIKGDFFNFYKFEYIILQNVERNFIKNNKKLDITKTITSSTIDSLVVNFNYKKTNLKSQSSYKLLTNKSLKIPYYAVQRLIKEDYIFNNIVVKAETVNSNLFSVNSNELLFYKNDLNNTEINNLNTNVKELNVSLNHLNELLRNKGIKLIVLPSPDKYDMYYDFIKNKSIYKKPYFFKLMSELKKEYIYIDSKKLLQRALKSTKDIYFYDDTHWSPKASKIIYEEIKLEIAKTIN